MNSIFNNNIGAVEHRDWSLSRIDTNVAAMLFFNCNVVRSKKQRDRINTLVRNRCRAEGEVRSGVCVVGYRVL